MLIRKRENWQLRERDVTDEALFRDRRRIIKTLGVGAAAAGLVGCDAGPVDAQDNAGKNLSATPNDRFSTDEDKTSFEAVTSYNNFYEFGTDKGDPARYAGAMQTDPWSIQVEGAVARPRSYALEELIDFNALEERIYRLRCVEAWSMVVPWIGVPLAGVIDKLEPLGRAKYVEFETLLKPGVMHGVRFPVLDWPYVEGLRLDEARNPLTLLAVGVYGKVMPNQNGAPVRLIVPWKYGFKSIKSIVKIRFVEDQPRTSWNRAAPREYGFYSNVNPNVDHPRWSQARERRIGEFTKRPTLMFNGYGEQVAHLYEGMDLRRYY